MQALEIPIYGVILAGGWGTRFWPLSRSEYPKQVLRLLGSESMLQSTVERLLPRIPPERLAVVTNASQAGLIHQELHPRGWDAVRLLLEPQGRNTAAAVGLAAVSLLGEAGDGVMAVFPADHYIRDQASLLQGLDLGAGWAQAGYLVTFGIPPNRPETGYGYIRQGTPLDDQGRAFRVDRFIEKPPLARAREFLADGRILLEQRHLYVSPGCRLGLPTPAICRTYTGNWSGYASRRASRPWRKSTSVFPISL